MRKRNHRGRGQSPLKAMGLLANIACLCAGRAALADFGGTPTTFKVDGGWCWFQDPRAIIDNGHLIIGSVSGTTVSGVSTAGDENATDYNLNSKAITNTILAGAYDQDDHASPALAVLPDNRVLVTYESHGGSNNVLWRVTSNAGDGTAWGAQQTSIVNTANDGNGNTYNNPYYLSVDNTVYDFSRAIGYDTNYSKFTGLSSTDNSGINNAGNFSYGGHLQYWQNPGTGTLSGGNGRPYVKYASNGTDKIWLATTEDSPQNYQNSLYCGYVQFNSSGGGTVYTSTGTALGGISTGTAPTGSANPPTSGGNQGSLASGTGYSYNPTQFTPIAEANTNYNGFDLSSSSPYGAGYVGWGSSMQLDSTGNPYLGFVVTRSLTGAYGNNLEYDFAHLVGGAWQVSRLGYAGFAMYNGQNQYAGLIAVDPMNPNKVYVSDDVNPVTDAAVLGPDGNQHWEIFAGVANGSNWSWTQLTNTTADNFRPIIASGGGQGGQEALLWMQGTYTAYTNYSTNVVGLIQNGTAASTIIKADTSTLSAGSDWVNGVVAGSKDIALIDSTVSSAHEANLTSSSNLSLQGLTVSTANGPVMIQNTSPFTLTLGAGGINMLNAAQNLTIKSSLSLAGAANQIWTIAAGRTLTLSTGTFTRSAGATLNIQNSGTLAASMTGLANDASENGGILGAWATIGSGANATYAALSGGNVVPYTYLSGSTGTFSIPSTTTAATNYRITTAGSVTFGAATRTLNTLNVAAGPTALTFGNSGSVIQLIANGILNASPGPLTISRGGSNTSSGVQIGASRELDLNAANAPIIISAPIMDNTGGASALNVVGTNFVTLSGANTYTGGTTITTGTLTLASATAYPTNTALTLGPGATLAAANHGAGAVYVPRTTTLSNSGAIDLTNDGMVIHNASIGTIAAQVANGYRGGGWNGSDGGVVTSSLAAADATHLTAVGVATGLTSFEGGSVAASDVLLKYTYYGDANLDGKVDGSDYSRIDSGYLSGVTGWYNGDFNYDGTINGSDYALIDNAFNTQGAQLTTQIAGPSAAAVAQIAGVSSVPEPACVALLAFFAAGLLGRRQPN